jgi:hypothetical protein
LHRERDDEQRTDGKAKPLHNKRETDGDDAERHLKERRSGLLGAGLFGAVLLLVGLRKGN